MMLGSLFNHTIPPFPICPMGSNNNTYIMGGSVVIRVDNGHTLRRVLGPCPCFVHRSDGNSEEQSRRERESLLEEDRCRIRKGAQ